MEKLQKKAYPEEFLTPMNMQKQSKDPMPEVSNFGSVTPPDPLGVVPPASGGGSIGSLKGGKR